MTQPITITITPEDAEKAGSYHDGHHCLLATAAERQGIKEFHCGGTWALIGKEIDGEKYYLDDEDSDAIINAYEDSLTKPIVREPFTVTLRP